MDDNHSFVFTGNERVIVQDLVYSIKNSFTYELWVKPEGSIVIDTESQHGTSGIQGQRYMISPGHGGSPELAGMGISMGTNGIAVYEHSDYHMPATLVYPFSCTDWTHIAVVYNNKTPLLYVNGSLVKRGLTSLKPTVCPSAVFGGHTPYGAFIGQIKEIKLWAYARTADQIQANMNNELSGSGSGLFGSWKFEDAPIINDFSSNSNLGFIGWENYHDAVLKGKHQFKQMDYDFQVVDIVIPIYNGLDYLRKCIDSLFQNSDSPYNLILIDDCSTDPNVFLYLEELKSAEKPRNLKELIIIQNERNQGFTKNANIGMSKSQNHVILLNSDTVVPKDWLSRMLTPFHLNNKIASSTPFSNNASICSFPMMDHDNPLPENMTIDEIDAVFRKYSTNVPIPIPVGVGFCMALNRNVMNEIGLFDEQTFGTGYCEENDWCQRAFHAGYRNILIPNLFVYHKMGASFRALIGYGREEQICQNYQKLLLKYSDFTSYMDRFLAEDPAKQIRDVVASKLTINHEQLKVSCILTSYNRPKKILESIESVKAQTYSNWELIIVDDNSNEETQNILKKMVKGDTRLRLIQSGVKDEERYETTRYATCINLTIPHITGDLVTYLTDDDIYYPQRFEKMVQKFIENPDVSIVYGKQKVVFSEGISIEKFRKYFETYYTQHWMDYKTDGNGVKEFVRPLIGVTRYPMYRLDHNSFMHRRTCFDIVGGWDADPAYWTHADLQFFKKLTVHWDFHPVNYVTDEHRIHSKGIQEKLKRGENPWEFNAAE